MDKRKQQTEKTDRVVTQVEESEEITFEQFERTVIKVVRAKPDKNESRKNKSGGRSPQP